MAFLLYPPGSSEVDLLQAADLNVGQHSTRFGGERPRSISISAFQQVVPKPRR
jgi:hypothetical protein